MPPLDPKKVGLPPRPFLYTLDQIADLLMITPSGLKEYIHFDGRSVGSPQRTQMVARNIALSGKQPDWRVAEQEFTRWLRVKGFRVYARGFVQ